MLHVDTCGAWAGVCFMGLYGVVDYDSKWVAR